MPTSKAENKVQKAIGKSGGKKRYQAAAGLRGGGTRPAGSREEGSVPTSIPTIWAREWGEVSGHLVFQPLFKQALCALP